MNDLVWAAGFFDGEGCISIDRRGGGSIVLTIGNTDTRTLSQFKNVFPFFNIQKRRKREPHHKDFWVLQCGGAKNVKDCLQTLFPYLVGKQEQALMAIGFCSLMIRNRSNHILSTSERQFRESLARSIQSLKLIRHANLKEDEGNAG